MADTVITHLIRKKALEAVKESTEMLKQSIALQNSGNLKQAEELQKAARTKRSNSVWLMQRANKLERDS